MMTQPRPCLDSAAFTVVFERVNVALLCCALALLACANLWAGPQRQRLVSDDLKSAILLEHFKEGEDTKQSCLSCHDLPTVSKKKTETLAPLMSPALSQDAGQKAVVKVGKTTATADHRQFDLLKQAFRSGETVTQACLSCHNEAGWQVMQGVHGREHISDPKKVDCLICHDKAGEYLNLWLAFQESEDMQVPPWPVHVAILDSHVSAKQWSQWAQAVGKPHRQQCLSCHADSNTKHAQQVHLYLPTSLHQPSVEQDVHMNERVNFSCHACHTTRGHAMIEEPRFLAHEKKKAKLIYGPRGGHFNALNCEFCHTPEPHDAKTFSGRMINAHVKSVACQSCHVDGQNVVGVQWIFLQRATTGEGAAQDARRLWPVDSTGQHIYSHPIITGKQGLGCASCHGGGLIENSSMAGMYLLGQSSWRWVDWLGVSFVLFCLLWMLWDLGRRRRVSSKGSMPEEKAGETT